MMMLNFCKRVSDTKEGDRMPPSLQLKCEAAGWIKMANGRWTENSVVHFRSIRKPVMQYRNFYMAPTYQ